MCHGGCVKTEDRAKLHCSVTVTPTGCPLVSTLHVLSFVLGNNVNLLQLGDTEKQSKDRAVEKTGSSGLALECVLL